MQCTRNGRTDSSRSTGDHRDLACERSVVAHTVELTRRHGLAPVVTHGEQLAGHIRRLGRQEEPQRTGHRGRVHVHAGVQHNSVRCAAVAHFVGNRTHDSGYTITCCINRRLIPYRRTRHNHNARTAGSLFKCRGNLQNRLAEVVRALRVDEACDDALILKAGVR